MFPDVSLPFEKFDVVAGFDVVEHFSDPLNAMRRAAELLNDNGIYFFQVPCYRGEGREWVQFRPNEHIFLYNSQSIRRLLEFAGLEVTEILPGYFPDDMFVVGRKRTVRNLLFVRTDSIGDNVLAASMLLHIRKKFEHARITVLCQEHIAELYEDCPFVDNVVVFNRKRAYEDAGYRNEIINRLKVLKPDVSLNSVFSSEPITHIFATECGAGERIAIEGDLCNISAELRQKYNQSYTKLLPSAGEHKPELARHRDFLKGLGVDVPLLEPLVWTSQEDENFAKEFFEKNNLKPENTIALFPAAQHFEKVYPFYHQILRSFNEFNFVILGGSDAKLLAKEICENLAGKCHDLTGKTSIRQMASILRRCRLYLGADSAGAHIACAVGIPNIVVLGGGHFGRFVPYSPLTSVVCLPLECYGCDWKCGYKRPYCVKDIAPQVFAEAVWQTFQKPSERIRVFVQASSLWTPESGQPKWRMFERLPAAGDVEIITVGEKTAAAPSQTYPYGKEVTNTSTQSKKDGIANAQEHKYLVSAIVSTYNSERFIRGCLEDLENQTIADRLEIIVVDSGSQQSEETIVREFQQKYDNIKYIKTEQREGVYSAWNRAIKIARGKFITNANTDDRHRKDALQIMADTLLANPDVALVYADQIRTNTPNDSFADHHGVEMLPRPDYSRQRLVLGCCVGSQPMWRKSLHNEFGYFDDTLICAGDWDFWLRISSKYKFKRIPEFLGLYYYNKDGIEHGKKIHSLYERYVVGKRYGTPYISVIPLYQNRNNLLVSVIMPAYNAAVYIAEAIESVLIQNYRNFELIVVNDGSTDQTEDKVLRFKDKRIRYFCRENKGPAGACNLGIKNSRGDFLVRLDSDDMMTPDFITKHLQEFDKHPEADLVYCDDCLIGEDDNTIRIIERPEYSGRKSLIRDLFRCGFPVVPFRTCIRKSVFDKVGLFDEKLLVAEDYDMMRRFVKNGLKAHHLKGALYLRRMTSDSLSANSTDQKAKCHFEVFNRFADTFAYDELFPDIAWGRIASQRRQLCAKCLTAITCLAIGQSYVKSNSPACAKAAFDHACSDLKDCLNVEPNNRLFRQLLHKSELVCAGYALTMQESACSLT